LGKLSHVLRPMMIGFPIVAALNRFRSVDRRHGMSPSRPITPFPAIATWMTIEGLASAGASDIGSVVMVRLHDENIDVALRVRQWWRWQAPGQPRTRQPQAERYASCEPPKRTGTGRLRVKRQSGRGWWDRLHRIPV